MSETLRRYRIRSDRPLIETDRVIDSELSWIVTQLDGSHLEILRNLMAYAHERTSYVSEYGLDWYLIPDDDEWDAIDAIVSELEERLMPADNMPFAWEAVWSECLDVHNLVPGQLSRYSSAVPEGYAYRLESAYVTATVQACSSAWIGTHDGTYYFWHTGTPQLTLNVPLELERPLLLTEGMSVHFIVNGTHTNDDFLCGVWGYKIKLPG